MKMRNAILLGTIFSVLTPCALAQTAFERMFDPHTTLFVILEMNQTDWTNMAAEQPVGGICNFNVPPTTDRYQWHNSGITIVTESQQVSNSKTYANAGVKKKSFCGSIDTVKPSLTINLSKFVNNDTQAEQQIGTVHLSLENSKQDPDLFHQCAGYYIFRSLGIPAPMCTFAGVYRHSGTALPVFLGLYVVTEAVKKDFFKRRPSIDNVPAGSLYEFEVPDDFTPATLSQLQVEWSSTSSQDFNFAESQVQNQPATALHKVVALPDFVQYWAAEIFLKHWDGYFQNRNNTFVFDDPPVTTTIQRTRFRFIPHGPDQILATNSKPVVYSTSALGQLGLQDNGVRYQLAATMGTTADRIAQANVAEYLNSYVPVVLKSWRGADPFFGNDANKTKQMAENVRLAVSQAVVDSRTVFGYGVADQPVTPTRLVDPFHNHCITRVTTDPEARHEFCSAALLAGQTWVFDSVPLSMGSDGFADPLKLYQVRNQGTTDCLTAGNQFPDGTDRYKVNMTPCSATAMPQRFFVVRREGAVEIKSFVRNNCIHFSDAALTTDSRPAIYLGACGADAKSLIWRE